MQTSNANKHGRSNDPVWQFLAEYPLSEFLSDHDKEGELTAGLLFQTMRELGIPLDYLENIDMTLKGFAKEALVHFKQGKIEFPIVIRLFYGKKLINSGNSAKAASDIQAKQTIEPTQIILPADTKIFGGWGFFIIERARDFPVGSFVGSLNIIDLYLYQEGE